MSLISCLCCRLSLRFLFWGGSFVRNLFSRSLNSTSLIPPHQPDDRFSHVANKTVGERFDFLLLILQDVFRSQRCAVRVTVNCARGQSGMSCIVIYQSAIREHIFSVRVSVCTSVCAAHVFAARAPQTLSDGKHTVFVLLLKIDPIITSCRLLLVERMFLLLLLLTRVSKSNNYLGVISTLSGIYLRIRRHRKNSWTH